jgi:hypothetical protein
MEKENEEKWIKMRKKDDGGFKPSVTETSQKTY